MASVPLPGLEHLLSDNASEIMQTRDDRNYEAQFKKDKYTKLTSGPKKKYIILTCMDARIDPVAAFGIVNVGDCHVIRNAGGSAVAALRDIIISQTFMGTNEIMLIKHGKCGMAQLGPPDRPTTEQGNKAIINSVKEARGAAAAAAIRSMDFLAFDKADIDPLELQALRSDAEFLRNHPAIVKPLRITAFHYCVVEGRLVEMDIDGLLHGDSSEAEAKDVLPKPKASAKKRTRATPKKMVPKKAVHAAAKVTKRPARSASTKITAKK
ncbi:unnamed protein product [Discula destructiva]